MDSYVSLLNVNTISTDTLNNVVDDVTITVNNGVMSVKSVSDAYITNMNATKLIGLSAGLVSYDSSITSPTITAPLAFDSNVLSISTTPSFTSVSLATDPTTALQAATKQYVDGLVYVNPLSVDELLQLGNIGSTTISATQWGYVGGLNQALTTSSGVTFTNIGGTLTTASQPNITSVGVITDLLLSADPTTALQAATKQYVDNSAVSLTADEITQLGNIGSTTISATQWGYVGGLDQALTTSSGVNFSSVDCDALSVTHASSNAVLTLDSSVGNNWQVASKRTADGGQLQFYNSTSDILPLHIYPDGQAKFYYNMNSVGITPSANNAYNSGSASNRWANLYAVNLDMSSTSIALGLSAGSITPGTNNVAIGPYAGTVSQGDYTIAMGHNSGYSGQGNHAVALGYNSGYSGQSPSAVAIGQDAAQTNQGQYSVAIGVSAGKTTQGQQSVAISINAGLTNQGQYSVAIGSSAGRSSQGSTSVAIGQFPGYTSQGNDCVAIGTRAGFTNQSNAAVSIGTRAGMTSQGIDAVAVGSYAGNTNQSTLAIAMGHNSGYSNQGIGSVALGKEAAYADQSAYATAVGWASGRNSQGFVSTAIGTEAGYNTQGDYALALGFRAGYANQHDNSIVINATTGALNTGGTDRLYIKPIRAVANIPKYLCYDDSTGEISHSSAKLYCSTFTSRTTAGTQSVTGVGFKPVMVKFTILFPSIANRSASASGVMTDTSQFCTTNDHVALGNASYTSSSTVFCLMFKDAGGTNIVLATSTTFDTDGFTIYFHTVSSAYEIGIECHG
jgi:hypothetical protein